MAFRSIFILFLVIWAGTATAVLPPKAYDRMRNAAPIHLTMRIEGVRLPSSDRGSCAITGPITDIHRDRGKSLTVGQRITVFLPCARANAPPRPGPTFWFSAETLVPGRRLRAYLNANLGVAAEGSGTKIIK